MGGLCLRHAGRCGRWMRCDEKQSDAGVFGGLYRTSRLTTASDIQGKWRSAIFGSYVGRLISNSAIRLLMTMSM
jgi:hypothetical protein